VTTRLAELRRGRRHADGKPAVRQLARDLRHGARALRGQPAARPLLSVTVIYLAANASLSALLIPLGIQRLGGGERTGLLLACLGAGFLLGAPVIRVLIDRIQPRNLLAVTLAATACGYFLLFSSTSLVTALPAAVIIGTFGSMSLVIPQTTVQRLIPGAVLGRVSAIFLTGEAAATLAGAVAGPFLAQAAGLETVAAAASLLTLGAAALARLTVPRIPVSRADGELRSFLLNGPVVTPTRPPSSSSR
jgi:predicted MFS family arabinose efflux permease